MEHVTIVGVEGNSLVLATESGTRFALAIDEVLRREVRRAQTTATPAPTVSPREIQSHIRSGLSSSEVAELLGLDIEDVRRFEAPVLAEREHIIGQALAVPVLLGSEVEPAAQPTFGAAIRAKLAELGATGETWASWKDESGWTVKLEFAASDIAHDARWSFDPRSGTLAPLNTDASALSRQGPVLDALIPRLRALDTERSSPYKDDARFEPESFTPDAEEAGEIEEAETPRLSTLPVDESVTAAVREAAMTRAPEDDTTSAETADLLAALRRRRGQREAPPSEGEEPEISDDPIALFGDLIEDSEPTTTPEPTAHEPERPSSEGGSRRRGKRDAMPSWDEIVFGARTDD